MGVYLSNENSLEVPLHYINYHVSSGGLLSINFEGLGRESATPPVFIRKDKTRLGNTKINLPWIVLSACIYL